MLEKRLRIRAVTTKAAWLLVHSYEGDDYEVRVARENGEYGCVCQHGSVWRFNRVAPGICYHAEGCYALLDLLNEHPDQILQFLAEGDGAAMDGELRLSVLSFLSAFNEWRAEIFQRMGVILATN